MADGIGTAALNPVIDMADNTSKKALEAVGALENVAVTAGQGAITAGDKSFDALMEEAEKTRAAFVEALRAVAATVTAPIDSLTGG